MSGGLDIVIFGLTISSSWGNGHATLWRGLVRALTAQGHHITFFERDQSFYAQARDVSAIEGGRLTIYADFADVRDPARRAMTAADVVIITSYCPDALEAERMAQDARGLRVFYDLDAPVTLARLERGELIAYIGAHGLADYDCVLSYTGGRAMNLLRSRLGARAVWPLYGHVDPAIHAPGAATEAYRADLSYLGTYAQDRQAALEQLFVAPARALPQRSFLIGGAQYPADFPWSPNIYFVRHLPPAQHPAFYASSRLTLNVTRRDMAALGWCPSGRLFEAAACGACLVSDAWEGLDAFFTPGVDILIARDSADIGDALEVDDAQLRAIAQAGRARVLERHSSAQRARDMVGIFEQARRACAQATEA